MNTSRAISFKDLPGIFKSIHSNTGMGLTCFFSNNDLRIRSLACGYPEYLLSTEINILFHYLPNLFQQTFIATLLNTGVDVNEATSLTRKSFILKPPYPYVCLPTVNSTKDIPRCLPSPSRRRIIPLLSKHYVTQLRQMLSERELTHHSQKDTSIWDIDRATATRWLTEAIHRANGDGIQFPLDISLETFKSSYAVYMLTLGVTPFLLRKFIVGN
ncbi:tyrosine-type recombinase/integrase [Citrobacter amalonaticus]